VRHLIALYAGPRRITRPDRHLIAERAEWQGQTWPRSPQGRADEAGVEDREALHVDGEGAAGDRRIALEQFPRVRFGRGGHHDQADVGIAGAHHDRAGGPELREIGGVLAEERLFVRRFRRVPLGTRLEDRRVERRRRRRRGRLRAEDR
jgi:hypothetical protein